MIFIDTGPFLARFLANDQFHGKAITSWERLEKQNRGCCTSNFVLDETITLLARRAGYRFASERAQAIFASSALSILRPEIEDELEALRMFDKFADNEVSFTDCVSFALMRRHGVKKVFTFDKHFQQAGFSMWS